MLPEFIPLWKDATLDFKFDAQSLTIQRLPEVVDRLTARLQFALDHANGSGDRKALYQRLLAMLPDARSRALALIEDLQTNRGHRWQIRGRNGLPFSSGSAAQAALAWFRGRHRQAPFRLLRLAGFGGAHRGIRRDRQEDIPQDVWFLLGRSHTREHGPGPGEQDRKSVLAGMRAAKQKPDVLWDIFFGDGGEYRDACL